MGLFEDELSGMKQGAHPVEAVPYFLATANEENNKSRMKSLELWFMGYQAKRNEGIIFKSASAMV